MQKKRIMISALALVVVALVASWGVNAYFNDVEQTNGNSVTSGTLDLKLNGADNVVSALYVTPAGGVYPGYTSYPGFNITLTNAGTIAGYVNMTAVVTSTSNGTDTEPELKDTNNNLTAGGGDLQEVLRMKIIVSGLSIYDGLVADFMTNTTATGWTYQLASGGEVKLTVILEVPGTATNQIQGDTLSFTLGFTLNQNVDNDPVSQL